MLPIFDIAKNHQSLCLALSRDRSQQYEYTVKCFKQVSIVVTLLNQTINSIFCKHSLLLPHLSMVKVSEPVVCVCVCVCECGFVGPTLCTTLTVQDYNLRAHMPIRYGKGTLLVKGRLAGGKSRRCVNVGPCSSLMKSAQSLKHAQRLIFLLSIP